MIDLIKEYESMTDAEKAYYWVCKYHTESKRRMISNRQEFRESGKTQRSRLYKEYEISVAVEFKLRRLKNKIAFELDKGNRPTS